MPTADARRYLGVPKAMDATPAVAGAEERQQNYQLEKQLGSREHDGSVALKKLRPVQLKILLRYIEGVPPKRIADEFGRSYTSVVALIRNPTCQHIIRSAIADAHEHMKTAQIAAIQAVTGGLQSERFEDQMKAVDRYISLSSHLGVGGQQAESAEDVAAKILERLQVNVQVNVNSGD